LLVEILLPLAVDKAFFYKTNIPLAVGDLVSVPFRSKVMTGVVWHLNPISNIDELKIVLAKHEIPPLKQELLDFVKWVSSYHMLSLGSVFKMVMAGAGPEVLK
jgi:primosomal protein N' (replication factor Y)